MAEVHMTPLHSEQIRQENDRKIKSVRMALIAWLLLGAALIAVALVWRSPTSMDTSREKPAQAIVTGLTLAFGASGLLLRGMKLAPKIAYRRFLKELRGGLSHVEEGVVIGFDEDATFREGLDFYRLTMNVGDLADPKDERILYWDANLPKPALEIGARVRANIHGNDLIALEICKDGE